MKTEINEILQWSGAVFIIAGHSLNAVGPEAYPWNILAFFVALAGEERLELLFDYRVVGARHKVQHHHHFTILEQLANVFAQVQYRWSTYSKVGKEDFAGT